MESQPASRAPCGHLVVDARVLALVITPAALRRLRVTHRGNPEIYESLLAITAVLLASSERSRVALSPAAGHAGYMTSDQFAAAVGVTARAIQLACRQGKIRATKRAGTWWIDDPLELARRVLLRAGQRLYE